MNEEWMSKKDFKLYSFGIGDCDKELIEKTGEYGQGKSYYVPFDKLDQLKGQVVDAIERSLEPILHDCDFKFGSEQQLNA